MTPAERTASEAKRLLNEPLLVDAFETVKMDAMLALLDVDPDNKTEILRLQAMGRCLDDVLSALTAAIHAGGMTGGGVAMESEPTD